jgi:sulfate permease, SulP family
MVASARKPTFAELYAPKLVTVLREGYRLPDLKADVVAGLTVAIVALPLSMAIAIGSGVTPERGLYTSIVGGFVVALLGGSRFQIGGPAGAFIVLVAATVQKFGVDGLLTAAFMSGLILLLTGFLRLGQFIKYIPFPVTVGFTSGIAVIIFAGQLKELLGLHLNGPEPGPFLPKLAALAQALPTASGGAITVAVLTILLIVTVRRFRPHWPAFLIGVTAASALAALLHLPVDTIGSRFGAMPRTLPVPHLPDLSPARLIELLPSAASFALLGGIESLLSAVVADSMSGRRHRSNVELVAQGAANMASAVFGGICVTGTIARTATNVRAGARGPVACLAHALFILLFMVVAAPLAGYIPLSALAAVLAVVCWTMAEKHEFATLVRSSRGDAAVLLATFLLVVFRDLTQGILIGFGLGALLFLHRMAQAVEVERPVPRIDDDKADGTDGDPATQYDGAQASDAEVVVYRISGAFFFGSAAMVGAALDEIGERPKAYVIDVSAVPLIDSTAAATIAGFARRAHRHAIPVYVSGARPAVREVLAAHGGSPPVVRFEVTLEEATAAAHGRAPLAPAA